MFCYYGDGNRLKEVRLKEVRLKQVRLKGFNLKEVRPKG